MRLYTVEGRQKLRVVRPVLRAVGGLHAHGQRKLRHTGTPDGEQQKRSIAQLVQFYR
jgi:hypothetical protein